MPEIRVKSSGRPDAWIVVGAFAAAGLSACSPVHKSAGSDVGPDAAIGAPSVADVPVPPLLEDAGVRGRPPGPEHTHHAGSGCAGELVPVLATVGAPAECVLECASDPSCPAGMICDGRAPLSENGKPGRSVAFCAIGKRANGGKADAGAVGPTRIDPGVTPPAKRLDVRKNAAGVCPSGYASCGAACRLTCKTNADCDLATAHCTGGFCQGPGALPCK